MPYGLLCQSALNNEEPPYAERHVRWCERSENESRKKTFVFLLLDFGLFDFQSFGCFSLVLVHYLGVDLGSSDILVGEHLADHVDVGAGAEEEGGVSVTEAVDSFGRRRMSGT